jgi:thiol-disulfide isomerase/thioredoxin
MEKKYIIGGIVLFVFFLGLIYYFKYYKTTNHFTVQPPEQITLYYAEWCGHCKRLKPDWDKFKQYVKDNNLPITIKEVEATELSNESEEIKNKISGFPTLIRDSTNEVIVGGPPILELLETLKTPTNNTINISNPNLKDITLYYSNNCPHCQRIIPEWLDFKRFIIDKKLPYICKEYEASEIPEDVATKINGFPTVLYNNEPLVGSEKVLQVISKFKNSGSKIEYNLYYSKTCSYSQQLLPTWFKFVNQYEDIYNITTQELGELDNNSEIKAKIQAVPTLIVNDNKETVYTGLDDIESLIKPMIK